MRPINQAVLEEAGFQIVHVFGEYLLAYRENHQYLLAWDGEHWMLKG